MQRAACEVMGTLSAGRAGHAAQRRERAGAAGRRRWPGRERISVLCDKGLSDKMGALGMGTALRHGRGERRRRRAAGGREGPRGVVSQRRVICEHNGDTRRPGQLLPQEQLWPLPTAGDDGRWWPLQQLQSCMAPIIRR